MMRPRTILVLLVRSYQWLFSPAMRFLFGTSGACRYSPTCSCYAIEALQRHGVLQGGRLTVSRLLRCHPWGGAGYDPVPGNREMRPDESKTSLVFGEAKPVSQASVSH